MWVEISVLWILVQPQWVILFVRMWVEISRTSSFYGCSSVILFVRMWVEIVMFPTGKLGNTSSSSWGCELKYHHIKLFHGVSLSSSSWGCELKYLFVLFPFRSHPVILFVRMWVEIVLVVLFGMSHNCHPLREDVSWNSKTRKGTRLQSGHPLREDVSWNERFWILSVVVPVILFVRMWVEIHTITLPLQSFSVILFVRMWVEISFQAVF